MPPPSLLDAFPVKEIASLGAAGVALVMCWLFLKHLEAARKESNDAVKDAADKFAKTTEKFGETTLTLHRESRESHERREQALHQLIRETRKEA